MNRLSDKIFLVVFILALFVPVLRLDSQEFSIKEKRKLATFPLLVKNGTVNPAYGKEFEDWFGDRFFMRRQIIRLSDKYRYFFSPNENKSALIGKDHWVFYKGISSIRDYQNLTSFSQDELEQITKNLQTVHQMAEKNNQRFFFLIGPDKHRVYGEFFYGKYKKQKPDSENKTALFLDYIGTHSDVKTIYPLDVFKRHKQDSLLYYKNDTHWNDMGGYLAYRELMKEMGREPYSVQFDVRKDGSDRDLAGMIKLKKAWYADAEYPFVAQKLPGECKSFGKTEDKNDNFICTNPQGKGKAIVFRDSFTMALQPYLAATFKEVKLYWHHRIFDIDPQELQQYDVIILERVERAVSDLKQMKK